MSTEERFRSIVVILADFIRDQITTGRRDPVGEREVLAMADDALKAQP